MGVVYKHIRNDNGEVFYIGIGKDKYRMGRKTNRNQWWHNIVNKYGYTKEIIIDNISWEQAVQLEIMIIAQYGRNDQGMGNLVNLTDGGEGINGMSDEHRKSISIPMSDENRKLQSNRMKLFWEEKDGMSNEHKNTISKTHKGKIVSKETRDKQSKSATNRIHSISSKKNQSESLRETHELKRWYGKEWRNYQSLPIDEDKRKRMIRRL